MVAQRPDRILARPVCWESHGRHTRTTWLGVAVFGGTEVECGHHGHKAPSTAGECAARLRLTTEAAS